VIAWADDRLPVAGLGDALTAAGLDVVDHVTPGEDHFVHNTGYHDIDAGITGALAGLAESGSIVLGSGPGEPRMASLVPLTHIALLRRSTLHRSLTHLVVEQPDLLSTSSNTIIVTGPSRTADIEQTLNLGVHGPRHLHVIAIEDL
jgi:L-lactate dehydrogenase complex protein LldG